MFFSNPNVVSSFCPCRQGHSTRKFHLYARSQQSGPFRPLGSMPSKRPKAKDWLTMKISDKMPDMPSTSNTAVGLFLFIAIIYILSSNEPVPLPAPGTEATEGFSLLEESVESAGRNVLKAALPQTASDVVSVALGEAIAGVIGAMATLLVSLLLRVRAANEQLLQGVVEKRDLVREAVADGDYFMTRAAALPLFEALGLSPLAASVTSVILASVPYEIIKLGSSRKVLLRAEDEVMEKLLKEEQERKRQEQGIFSFMNAEIKESVDVKSLQPAAEAESIDFVELFSDITKWLEYDVLKTDFNGRLMWNGQILASNVDSAIFGFLAALSSQLYADVAYTYTQYGSEEKRKESRERSLEGWIKLYTTISINSAVLFGVYESVKAPVANGIAGFLSGGVENCVGSEDYKTCMNVYISSNPPEADAAAQFRSLITAMVSLLDRIQNDGSLDKDEFTRSLIVQLYSLAEHIFSFSLFSADIGVPASLISA